MTCGKSVPEGTFIVQICTYSLFEAATTCVYSELGVDRLACALLSLAADEFDQPLHLCFRRCRIHAG